MQRGRLSLPRELKNLVSEGTAQFDTSVYCNGSDHKYLISGLLKLENCDFREDFTDTDFLTMVILHIYLAPFSYIYKSRAQDALFKSENLP